MREYGKKVITDEGEKIASALFTYLNRNKMSMVLNLKSTKGLETFKELVKISVVFVENYSPGQWIG